MTPTRNIEPEPAPASLVEYVISNMRIEMLVTTYQARKGPGVICNWRTLKDYNYLWVQQGQASWILDETEYVISQGDLVVVPKAVAHQGIMAAGEIVLCSIHVLPTLPGGKDVFNLLQLPVHRSLAPGSRLLQYLEGAAIEWGRSESSHIRPMLRAWSRLITIELIRHDHQAGQLRAVSVDPLVHEILDYLNQSINQPLTLDDLAEKSGFSAQHLNRTFKKVLGMTPLQYLTHMRLQQAADMLATGSMTIATVSESLGYEDQYYFSRLFKKHFGMAPAHWREHGADAEPASGSDNPS